LPRRDQSRDPFSADFASQPYLALQENNVASNSLAYEIKALMDENSLANRAASHHIDVGGACAAMPSLGVSSLDLDR
jgi:hypothetical protein